MSGKSRDYFSNLKTAGIQVVVPDECAANCIQPQKINNVQREQTPEHIKKYRKSYKQQYGVSILHYGLVDDAKKPQGHQFGLKTTASDHMTDIFGNVQGQGINQLINEIKESRYASNSREPLGMRQVYNYQWPDQVKENEFKFGKQTQANEYSAKEVTFPTKPIEDSEENHKQYVQSHGNYEAGEQIARGYKWNIDPQQHRFGKGETKIQNEIDLIMNPECSHERFQQTKIVEKKQEDFRNYKDDPLGRSKNLAQMNPLISVNTTFGERKKFMEWDAGQCITGAAKVKEVQPDSDLGKTNKFGFRNQVKEGDDLRVFGTSTIRDDKAKPKQKSMGDPNNYGDEKSAMELLYPRKYDYMGVDQKDFYNLRSKTEISDIFSSIGYKYKVGKFEGIFQRAKQLEQIEQDKVSVAAFLHAISEMDKID